MYPFTAHALMKNRHDTSSGAVEELAGEAATAARL
jgi:hypothetical protein